MEREKSAMFLGLGLLAAGIVVLLFVLVTAIGLAANPGPWMQRQLPANTQVLGPTAAFSWNANGLNVSFQDHSVQGSANITSYAWDFGDGGTSSNPNPTHTYASPGNPSVRLTVRDQNGKQSSADTSVNVQNAGGGNGQTNPGQGGVNFDLSSALFPIGIAILTFGLYVVAFLVGGSLVKAGWNLIRPRPETIRLRLKPQNWEAGATAEVVPPQSVAMPPAPPISANPSVPPPPPTA